MFQYRVWYLGKMHYILVDSFPDGTRRMVSMPYSINVCSASPALTGFEDLCRRWITYPALDLQEFIDKMGFRDE